MTASRLRPARRRWWAPEVVQTSGMDCGPAALKCLLDGHGVPVSYGRLREACQTDVDGTSIDTLEVVARQLGLDAQQQMLPADQLLPDGWTRVGSVGRDHALPALVVVRHADVATHFVVVWRRLGPWLQVMDPAFGRHWVHADRLRADLVRHEATVPAAAWRAWAAEAAPQACWRQGLRAIGLAGADADVLLARAGADAGWRGLATLDAALRLVQTLCRAGGVAPGVAAGRLLQALIDRCSQVDAAALASVVPDADWSVLPVAAAGPEVPEVPETETDADADPMLRLRGAVLLQVAGLRGAAGAAPADDAEPLPPLSPELSAALTERAPGALATVAQVLRADGLLAPLALAAALLLATGAVLLETLLLRGLLDLAGLLQGPGQRLGALAALLGFMAALTALDWPIARELLRHGRQLDTRLRLALLQKLPRLNDRYFQSRPVSDMADRAHALHLLRGVPALGFQLLQAVAELLATAAAVLWLAPHSAGWTLALLGTALALPWLAQPALRERDLRARHHQSALTGFHLDALLALTPVRAHRAQANVAAQHESLLLAWTEALRSSQRIGLASQGLQMLLGTGLAAGLVLHQVQAAGGWAGTDLLLAYWALRLPALGSRLSAMAQQLPGQRNVLLRLMEPLGAPDEQASGTPDGRPSGATEAQPGEARTTHPAAAPGAAPAATRLAWQPGAPRGLSLQIDGGHVVAGGHSVLQDLQLQVAAGAHVAIVGSSGAGKSSLLGVLLGWHRLASGRLLVDGQPLAPGDIDALRAVTAWVDPAVQLWNRPLLDNLTEAAAPDDRHRLPQVITAARLRGVLARLPQGLQTPLGEGGARLSGGEGQRVRLARAMLAGDTRLVLLDEPFRGLDHAQRQALLADARAWWQQHTLLCVTHDVGDTLGFDRVLVVHDGRIVEDGAPRHLAAQDSRYRQLLQAEEALRQQLWGSAAWRRLRLADGRLVEGAPAQAGLAAGEAGAPP